MTLIQFLNLFLSCQLIQQILARALLVPVRMASASLQALICLICFIALINKSQLITHDILYLILIYYLRVD